MVAFPNLIVLVVLVGIAAAEHVDEASALVQLVAAQGRQLEQMQQQLQLLAAAVAAINLKVLEPAQQDREQGAAMPGYLDSEPGRRLSAPASQRTAWHHGVLHSFDIPTTCGLHAELDSDATGPMSITRSSEGNVTMGYGGAAMATQPAAFEMNHPSNCRTATLTSNHPLTVSGSLTLGGNTVHSSPKMLHRVDFPANFGSPGEQFGKPSSWIDYPGLTHTPTLTKTSTILFVHYQISFSMAQSDPGGDIQTYLACRLMLNDIEETSARSITGSHGDGGKEGIYGTTSGTWIGAVSAGSPVIKVQCRSTNALNLGGDYQTKALTVAILG